MNALDSSFRLRPARVRRGALLLALALGTVAGASPSRAAAAEVPARRLEYQLKAGYLFNFLRFAEWPEQPAEDAPLRIGVLEDASASAIIAETLAGKAIDRHRIEVLTLKADDPLSRCHLLFLPRTANLTTRVPQPHGVLVVGERENFAAAGGMIGFVVRGYNIRFQVNLAAAQHAGIKLSSRLAALAEIVKDATP